jgi:hypothetical protein
MPFGLSKGCIYYSFSIPSCGVDPFIQSMLLHIYETNQKNFKERQKRLKGTQFPVMTFHAWLMRFNGIMGSLYLARALGTAALLGSGASDG